MPDAVAERPAVADPVSPAINRCVSRTKSKKREPGKDELEAVVGVDDGSVDERERGAKEGDEADGVEEDKVVESDEGAVALRVTQMVYPSILLPKRRKGKGRALNAPQKPASPSSPCPQQLHCSFPCRACPFLAMLAASPSSKSLHRRGARARTAARSNPKCAVLVSIVCTSRRRKGKQGTHVKPEVEDTARQPFIDPNAHRSSQQRLDDKRRRQQDSLKQCALDNIRLDDLCYTEEGVSGASSSHT